MRINSVCEWGHKEKDEKAKKVDGRRKEKVIIGDDFNARTERWEGRINGKLEDKKKRKIRKLTERVEIC